MAHVMEHILVRATMALLCPYVGCPHEPTVPLLMPSTCYESAE